MKARENYVKEPISGPALHGGQDVPLYHTNKRHFS